MQPPCLLHRLRKQRPRWPRDSTADVVCHRRRQTHARQRGRDAEQDNQALHEAERNHERERTRVTRPIRCAQAHERILQQFLLPDVRQRSPCIVAVKTERLRYPNRAAHSLSPASSGGRCSVPGARGNANIRQPSPAQRQPNRSTELSDARGSRPGISTAAQAASGGAHGSARSAGRRPSVTRRLRVRVLDGW